MALKGISGNVSSQITTAQTVITPPKPEAATPTPEKKQTTKTPAYTVELTGTALAKSLKFAGQTPAQIATKMGIDVKTVDSYLSIKATTPAPAPAPQAKPATTTTASAQPYSPAEEAKEPASEKAAETAQGKK